MATVLVVDDEPLVRDYVRRVLEREGFSVLEAEDGEHASQKCSQNHVDLVITDLMMPKKDGIEFIVELGKTHPDVGVIAISGGGRPQGCYLMPARAVGADRTLSKPFRRRDLLDAVNEVLNQVTFN